MKTAGGRGALGLLLDHLAHADVRVLDERLLEEADLLVELDDAALLRLLRENSFTRAVQEDQFAQRLAHTAAQALQGKYGADVREGFQELVRAFLLNESVFMPLNHMIIPLEWNDVF